MIGLSLEGRFWGKVQKTDGCWLWTASVDHKGYGQIKVGGRRGHKAKAHRLAYELVKGPVPDGLQVCHSCDVRRCVNPAHLWPGTRLDNMRDMRIKGRSRTGNKRPPPSPETCTGSCRKGHPRTPETASITKEGRWRCLLCRRAKSWK